MLFLQSNSFTIMIVSQKYQDLLQPNSCDRFSKISRTFYASRKSWIIVVFLLWTLKEKLPIFLINTLLLHIPLLALTDRQNYRETNRISRYHFTAAEFVFNFFLKKHSVCFLIWAGVWVLRTFAISMQLFPYFSYSCINILCSSGVHLPLFVLLFGKLTDILFPGSKEAGLENKSQWQAIVMRNGQWKVEQTKNE